MVMKERILGTTKITSGWKISLIEDVRILLNERQDKELIVSDKIVYVLRDGEIVIRRT